MYFNFSFLACNKQLAKTLAPINKGHHYSPNKSYNVEAPNHFWLFCLSAYNSSFGLFVKISILYPFSLSYKCASPINALPGTLFHHLIRPAAISLFRPSAPLSAISHFLFLGFQCYLLSLLPWNRMESTGISEPSLGLGLTIATPGIDLNSFGSSKFAKKSPISPKQIYIFLYKQSSFVLLGSMR